VQYSELLNFLLSGEDPEVVVEKIHNHLRELSKQMREYTIPTRKYTIYTQLGKNPKEYPNGNSMPSVQVALRLLAKGKHVKAKDVMSFIITGESSGSAENAAKNAFPVDEVLKSDSELKPDIDYYLHKQILPPVERLCAPISGTNITLLAACLGLDTSKYRSRRSQIPCVSRLARHCGCVAVLARLHSHSRGCLHLFRQHHWQSCKPLATTVSNVQIPAAELYSKPSA
jgi:hypothetical protein